MPMPGMPGSDQPSPSRRTALWKAPPFQPPAQRPQGPTGDALGYRVGLGTNQGLSPYRQFLDSVATQERRKRPGGMAGSSVISRPRPMRQIFTGP